MTWPATALLSLSDKGGAADFARALAAGGTRILASGGTAAHLKQAGVTVTPVEKWTGFSDLLGGRVKTLHPHVHAPILARRAVAADMTALAERELEPIDLVAVTLYPFETKAAALDDDAAVEEIDIGGVALLRAAAKNHADVIVVHDPSQYREVLEALESGAVTRERRRAWALRTFARTARYDAAIANELGRRSAGGGEAGVSRDHEHGASALPALHVVALERVRALRYGENPHQEAGLYTRAGAASSLTSSHEGKELSYNNLLDLEAAVSLVWRWPDPACVIVKHAQPCGVACAETLVMAYERALKCDEQSAYGGIVAFNRPLDHATALRLASQFVECISAPVYTSEAEELLKGKKNLRTVSLVAEDVASSDPWSVRMLGPWALLQREAAQGEPAWRPVTRRAPSEDVLEALRFAWEVAAAARSNAIAIARGTSLIGLGSGQASRVDAVDVALMKARRAGHDLQGAVLASDGFFPFADNVEHAADAGIVAIVQPGGSKRDAEVVAACDARGIAMLFTDRRTFRH
ncbi:MAG TPA: bifunctional phosphoribosylaminoimidazolecarboxamide formyltransferase/IMP cyclohydrolase [Candidatus Limnocylindria bacterium]|nr:bifunctional phosphoribosylaminoimidazolecarboxamide formyltransferase/IMP cyclohydrolase [Candidatus Limnocylindria bacterium]